MIFKGYIIHEGYEEEITGNFDSEKEFILNAYASNHGREFLSIVVEKEHSSIEYTRDIIENMKEDKKMKKYAYQIDYKSAIEWCGNKYVQPFCEMYELDPQIWELGTRRGAWPEDCEKNPEVFQVMLSDCSDDDVEFLTKRFPDLLFIHGVRLDNWFLCVDHFGTAWDYVFTAFQPDEEGLMLPKIWMKKKDGICATSERVFNTEKHANFKRYEVEA